MVSTPSLNNLGKFKECGVRTTHCNTEVVRVSRVLFLAVKPRIIPSILQEVSAVVTPQHIIVSVAAGVTVATLEQLANGELYHFTLLHRNPRKTAKCEYSEMGLGCQRCGENLFSSSRGDYRWVGKFIFYVFFAIAAGKTGLSYLHAVCVEPGAICHGGEHCH
ncbi:UNVERIFIED_CONTAM: hypothetical protein FKN15_027700 [Acipenser sinensis]